jgi:hypothetical protein
VLRIGKLARDAALALLGSVVILAAGCATTGGTGGWPARAADEEIWAVRCITLTTPDRMQRANTYAEALKKVAGLKPELVQVLSDEDGTAVFYGRYRRAYGPTGGSERFTPDHLRDMELIRSLRFAGADVWPFLLASLDVLPTYRSAHPEWNLADVEGYWSLHVAVFYNTATMRSRRSAAEQYCALLRQQGEEAYYHHGPVHSSVYVGTYPKEAVADVRRENPLTGMVQNVARIVDPRMLAAQQRFPTSTENGHTMYEIRRGADGAVQERTPTPSFPVIVPKAQRQLEQAAGRSARAALADR